MSPDKFKKSKTSGQGWGAPDNTWEDSWGSNAARPGHCDCACNVNTAANPKLQDDNHEEQSSDSDEDKEEPFDGVVERRDHYLVREQIWSPNWNKWLPYDASRFVIPVPEQDLGNYFYVNLRHFSPGDEGELVLSNFSATLVKFLRTNYGDEFYDHSPERTADSLLPDIPIFEAKLDAIKAHLSADIMDKRAFVVTLGCQEAKEATHPDSHLDQLLAEAQEHISVLHNYLMELYEPKAEKLALQLSDGCIEFELLIFYFELNKRYCLNSENPHTATAFTLEKRSYTYAHRSFNSPHIKSSLSLSGSGYVWDGRSYSEIPVGTTIYSYRGTKDLKLLSCQPLSPDVEAALVARGRLYIALAGCQYRSHRKDRIIVDKLGSDSNPEDYVRESSVNEEIPDFPDEDLWLLPGTVDGFNLTKKFWTSFPVLEIGPVAFDENAWDHLVLDPETKILIKSLVQVTRNSNTTCNIISDVITGKGGGLICVLHGPPGTGKTLTAEAVAEHLKRPLYIVGASELSTKPEVLERKLKSILSLATAWDAVLLIDEADVFLEQRSLHEIERNSLVSVALRVLEYHRGVLFLTTNRIKTFDVAFLSRFSIAIKYPEHDLHSRRVIWRKFFELAGVKTDGGDGSGRSTPTDMVKLHDPATVSAISDAELDALAEKPFNGRTIKNLVRTAQALALSSDEPMSKVHVDIVVRSQEKFLREFATA
ncbi:P-loop containing nucleoside triphosphate hydrolase protein [Mycena crocata]|nr:P-loop containing nucleoside triphosphate hydrolase protein [Mycena crocata]